MKFIKPLFLLSIIWVWSMILTTSCTFKAKVTVLSKASTDAYLKPKIYLFSDYFSQSTTITLTAAECDTTKELYFTENLTLVPLPSDSGWVTCDETDGAHQYQFSSSTIGAKTVYIWGKNQNGLVSEGAKTIQVKYSPRVLLGQNDYQSFEGTYTGFSMPITFKKIGSKYYLVNKLLFRVPRYEKW